MKIALCLSNQVEGARRIATGMLEAQRHEPHCVSRIVPFAFGCLGLLGRPGESPSDWPLWEGADGSLLAFAGLPIVSGGPAPGRVSATHRVVRGALAGDDPMATVADLGELDGAFVAVWWNARLAELAIVTDFLGMQPLYRVAGAGTTLFASEVKAFVPTGVLPFHADAGAWAAMLYFGHQIGENTLLAGVTRVHPAQAAMFVSPTAEQSTRTWNWPADGGGRPMEAVRDDLGEAIRADVGAYASAYPDASLLLSGGLDSRLILCLCNEQGLRPRLLVQSHPDENADADARFGEAFARTLALPVRRFPARADYYSTDDYLRFLTLNEVATPSLSLFIANVAPVVRAERHGVWEGLLLDPALKFDYGEGGFAPYLKARTAARRRAYGEAVRSVFAPEWAERMGAEYDAIIKNECARFADDSDGVWRFSVLNRSRFRTGVNPYQVYDTSTPALTPGMSKGFWDLAASLDPGARFGKRLYRDVFDRLAPDGLRVPVASGASLMPGRANRLLYHVQRARASAQRVAQLPRVTRLLRSVGLPAPFVWEHSRFLDVAAREAVLDDPRLNVDWIRRQREGGVLSHADVLAREVLMYWQAWHHVARGDLVSSWGRASEV